MKIALGSDHRGYKAATSLKPHLEQAGHDVTVLGKCSDASCDYPDSAWAVGKAVADGAAQRGVLICGSGIGMSMAANKVRGVRAALVADEFSARRSREHNDANVLCLSGDLLGNESIEQIVDVWLTTDFDGGRHARRVEKMMGIERGVDPAAVTSPGVEEASPG